ncbi:MAG: hypothetical protein RLW62_20505, partial [Gammaproteobacteria bacterium]
DDAVLDVACGAGGWLAACAARGAAVADGTSGTLVPGGDYPALVAAIRAAVALPAAQRAAGCRATAARFAWPRYTHAMRAVVAATMPRPGARNQGRDHE